MKAVIPVAGAGTRLRPHTYTQPKPLIPVAGKAIISFIIDELLNVGIDDFVFVIGYLGEKIQNFVETNYPHVKTEFVNQHIREGLGHAIWVARDALSSTDEIFIVLGDTIFDVQLEEMINSPHSCLGIKSVEDPREFGVVELTGAGQAKRVIEKPRIPKSNMALVGLYKIKEVPVLLRCIEHNIENDIRTLGEFQLTDGIMAMIQKGIQFNTLVVNNWFDCGKKEILLETNARMLDKAKQEPLPASYNKDSIIIPPVSIGTNCKLSNSIIGPHVTIGNNATITQAVVKNSIIGSYTSLEEVVLQNSLVGSDTAIKGLRQSLNIGDNTEIDFSSSNGAV